MLVGRVRFLNARAQRLLEIELAEGVNIIVGPNGAGKTTVLEALYLLLTGRPLRAANIRDIITEGAEVLRIEADLAGPTGHLLAAAAYGRDGTRRLTANGARLDDASRWKESIPVRTFVPDDLRLIKGSPRRRREYLDGLASGREPEYSMVLRRYEEALAQRNALLRAPWGTGSSTEFTPWERVLADTGPDLCRMRADTLNAFVPAFQEMYARLTGEPGVSLHLVYRTNAWGLDSAEYRDRLRDMRAADRVRTYTQLGPHRDDIRLTRAGLDVREYASQGEQRTILLSLVLAEWLVCEQAGRRPLLLLDDVMSELDPDRRRRLIGLLLEGSQVVITTADLRYFESFELEKARIIRLRREESRV